jgi:hypothetical protein
LAISVADVISENSDFDVIQALVGIVNLCIIHQIDGIGSLVAGNPMNVVVNHLHLLLFIVFHLELLSVCYHDTYWDGWIYWWSSSLWCVGTTVSAGEYHSVLKDSKMALILPPWKWYSNEVAAQLLF